MWHTRQFNSMRPELASGRPLFGWYVTFQIPDLIEMIGGLWDWIWIDMQHSPIDINAALSIIRAADAVGTYSLLRVGQNDPYLIAQALDMGPSGIIIPMVNTPEDARSIVRAAKFPPEGKRSYGGRRVATLYGLDYADRANEETVIFVQLESQEAFGNAGAIAAVDGIDGMIFSPDDFVRELGLNVITPRPPDLGVKEKKMIADAARKHGKVAACFADSPESLRVSLEGGFRMFCNVIEDELIARSFDQTQQWISKVTEEFRSNN